MRILILNWRDPKNPLSGGAELMLQKHALYWQKKGADIIWFASSFEGAEQQENFQGIHIIRKGSYFTVHLWAFIYYLKGKLQADTVIDCFHFLPFFTPLYLKKVKIIALIHEIAKEVWYKNLPLLLAFVGYYLEPLFFKPYKNTPFFTVSNSTKSELRKLGIQNDHITVIYNGIDIPRVKATQRSKIPVILYLGRIAEDKGIKDAVSAYEQIYKKDSHVELWIGGKEQKDGYLRDVLKNKEGKIKYFGYVSERKKFELFKKSWVLAHPSVREGWGLTVIEANSMGLPVVGYNVVGLRDSILDSKTGVLVKNDIPSLVKGLEKVIFETHVREMLSRNATKWSSKFKWNKSTRESWHQIKI